MDNRRSPNPVEQTPLPVTSFQSDDLQEKLKLLNYEKYLLRDLKMKPLSRFYFIKCFNPGEQFYMFTIICWWLCKKLGKDMEQPQEFDDPNTVIARVVKILEEMDMTLPPDFQPNKLIRGAGPICLSVLDWLATQALKVAKVSYQRPQITQEDEMATEYLEDNAEIILEKLDDEQTGALSDDSDMEMNVNIFKNPMLNFIKPQKHERDAEFSNNEENQAAERLTDQEQWRLEFERVLPHLKVFVKADARDWRSHLNQMETFKANIEEIFDDTEQQLKKMHNEFSYSADKVESREKHLNNELRDLIKQFKDVSIELSSIQYAQIQVQNETEQLQTQLSELIFENDNKKTEMEQRGQSMSDGSSVVQIKKAITKLKEESAHVNLEVALLVHAIDKNILKGTHFIV